MSSIDLGRTLRKLLAAIRTFQHQFSPDRNRINAHTLLHFLLHREMRRTLLQTYTQGPPQNEFGEILITGFAYNFIQSCHVSHSVAISLRIIIPRKKVSRN